MSNLTFGKRKRVRRACESCRALKSKCDGTFPICGRCEGYGYQCHWPDSLRAADGGRESQGVRQSNDALSRTSISLRNVIEAYEDLVRSFYVSSDADRTALNLRLSCIRRELPDDLLRQLPSPFESDANPFDSPIARTSCSERTIESPRYLGEASDIQFFNSIKDLFHESSMSTRVNDEEIKSYEQDDLGRNDASSTSPTALPSRELASTYIEIYFSTIHIAYPFLCKPLFLQQYDKFSEIGVKEEMDSTWVTLLYTIFAIGAYYISFPCREGSGNYPHAEYFLTAQMFSRQHTEKRSVGHVCALLVQCFYLLAVSQTDRCWINLGLAIRIGQSIGLHVESSGTRAFASAGFVQQELRRRTWYSMYVLDRLLALQLGRPAAIREEEYNTILPKICDDVSFDLVDDVILASSESAVHTNEYFLSVIYFSRIIGQVTRDLYNLTGGDSLFNEMLNRAIGLDKELSDWRKSLPRNLRFDLGHTFEKSITFQRQRNMLAIKFHHLRAMIHRHFLWSNRLHRNEGFLTSLSEEEHKLAIQLRRTCVSEARQTAHLLHKVPDERSLVQDFPWWQMISCLICASSILLVASACTESDEGIEEPTCLTLDEDAETCLKVFDALSANSDAARSAREMMSNLKEARVRAQSGDGRSRLTLPFLATTPARATFGAQEHLSTLVPPQLNDMALTGDFFSDGMDCQLWPGEISEPMAWSAQFVGASYDTSEYSF